MAVIQETAEWVNEIKIISLDDPVEGGENGIDNIPHQQLANRTAFLKQKVESVEEKVDSLPVPADHSQAIQAMQSGLEANTNSIAKFQQDLQSEIQSRIEGDNSLRGIIAREDGNVSLAALLGRIKTLEKLTSNMIIGSYIIKAVTKSNISYSDLLGVNKGHISVTSVSLSDVYNFPSTPAVSEHTTIRKDHKIMNGRVDITRDFVNKVVVPVPMSVESLDRISFEYIKGAVTTRYGGGDYIIYSDDLTMDLDVQNKLLTITGIWLDQVKVIFK